MGKAQINLQVDEQQKKGWKDYIEESGRFSSLSDLIRASVESEINGGETARSVESPAIGKDIQELKGGVDRIRKDVRWLRQQHQDAVDISDVAQEVFDSLPTLPDSPVSDIPADIDDADAFRQKEAAQMVIRQSSAEESKSPHTVDAIATRLGQDQQTIEDALEHLQEQFLPVVEVEFNGNTHYFKEE